MAAHCKRLSNRVRRAAANGFWKQQRCRAWFTVWGPTGRPCGSDSAGAALAFEYDLIEGVKQLLPFRVGAGRIRSRLHPCLRQFDDAPVLPVRGVPELDDIVG